jgi:hypothetical protein
MLLMTIESYIANEPFYGWKTSKLGRNGRVCGRIRTIGYVGINRLKMTEFHPKDAVGPAGIY